MIVQSTPLSRPVGAVQTHVRLLACVSTDVPLQTFLRGGTVGTVGTGEWLFPRVGTQVGNQIGGFPRTVSTVGTPVELGRGGEPSSKKRGPRGPSSSPTDTFLPYL